ncbi:MAG: GNAT family N-acetyltransferase [Planctomycetes bacterium]|nr:GNAT family N-acetyltransferase [Planctomycetota bacterium]
MPTRSHRCDVRLPIPAERAFAMLVEPSSIRAWWGASRAIVVPRQGGDWVAAWGADEDAPEYVTAATITAFEPPHRLRLADFRYVARAEGELPFDGRALTTEFTILASDRSDCVLRVEQSGFPCDATADAFFAACEVGWTNTLAGIERVAKGEVALAREGVAPPVIPVLETERLRLRAFRLADVGTYARHCADPEVMRFLGGRIWSRTESWRHLAMLVGHWQLRGFGMWAVERRSDGVLLGRVGCLEPDGWPGFEIGWLIGREHQGQGYATEAARASLAWARDVLGKDRIVHLIAAGNLASEAVAKKLGARPAGNAEVHGMPVVVWESRS